jgi:hypothetical protein
VTYSFAPVVLTPTYDTENPVIIFLLFSLMALVLEMVLAARRRG